MHESGEEQPRAAMRETTATGVHGKREKRGGGISLDRSDIHTDSWTGCLTASFSPAIMHCHECTQWMAHPSPPGTGRFMDRATAANLS